MKRREDISSWVLSLPLVFSIFVPVLPIIAIEEGTNSQMFLQSVGR